MYTITPMVVALGPQREKSRFTYMHNFGDKVDIPYVSWLIRGEDRVILVDAGCSADDYRTQIRGDAPLMLAGERFQDVVDVKPIGYRVQSGQRPHVRRRPGSTRCPRVQAPTAMRVFPAG